RAGEGFGFEVHVGIGRREGHYSPERVATNHSEDQRADAFDIPAVAALEVGQLPFARINAVEEPGQFGLWCLKSHEVGVLVSGLEQAVFDDAGACGGEDVRPGGDEGVEG